MLLVVVIACLRKCLLAIVVKARSWRAWVAEEVLLVDTVAMAIRIIPSREAAVILFAADDGAAVRLYMASNALPASEIRYERTIQDTEDSLKLRLCFP